MRSNTKKRPVTVVTGFLGSGKTTLLNKVLSEPSMKNTAVLVNEFGKVGLDHHLLRKIDEQTILLGGGCLCCTVRDDLVKALKDLLDMDQRGVISRVERIIIETSGLADPAPIIFTILTDPVLQHHYYVDLVLVTVDAVNGNLHLSRQPESIKQISAADKIIVTKTDIATPEVITDLIARLQSLNPSVQILEALSSEVALEELFRSQEMEHTQTKNKVVSFDTTRMNDGAHVPDTRSISLTFDKPLDWTAFGLWLSMLLHARGQDVLRVKGLIDVGEEGPVVLNGVQHIIHPPQHLASWPSDDCRSHLVFIMRSIDASDILTSLSAFQSVLGASPILLETNVHV
ncbi:CobW family GTP-binding protein [Effusibacillus consociatus]|uniref:CobW family GTP-binding protein n=1 Tax=Effusibacillus consociatus TaxID=1117041 RepID=A0ABV9Q5J0_9BACL